MRNIRSRKQSKESLASYGQVAKTLNVVLRVVMFYCNLPETMLAEKIVPFLHPAIDNKMMGYLRKNYRNKFPKNLFSIASVNKENYFQLQELVAKDMKKNVEEPLYCVQWEYIIWVRVNPKK